MSNKHKNLDESIIAYLKGRPEQYFACSQLATQFGVETRTMRNHVESLVNRQKIRAAVVGARRRFYLPTLEQEAARNEPVKPKHIPGQYQMSQQMTDLMARIRAERESIDSFFG